MLRKKWSDRRITDSAQYILSQVPMRARERGLHAVDDSSISLLVLWSLLLWERKIGGVALERIGVDPLGLAGRIDKLLSDRAEQDPVAYDAQQGRLAWTRTGQPYEPGDFEALVEPLLKQFEREAGELGHGYVGSEHIVLAITRNAVPPLSTLLQQTGVDHARVKEAVGDLLSLG